MTAVMSTHAIAAGSREQHLPLPDTVEFTRTTLRAWRELGYRISEQRVAGWLYLLARGKEDSAVYKVVGPVFDGPRPQYRGWRIG